MCRAARWGIWCDVNKTALLHWAEVVDSFRVFPRIFLAACFAWCVDTTGLLVNWYIHLPASEQSTQATGFGAVVLAGQLAFLKLVYQTYSDKGRDWNSAPGSSSSSTSTTTIQTSGAPP